MKISVVGAGYVGLVAAACFSDAGNEVVCMDRNISKIDLLRDGIVPIYEVGLQDLIGRNLRSGRLVFTTDIEVALKNVDICFVAVDTPPDENGEANLENLISAAEEIGLKMTKDLVVVIKSTVPVGTTFKLKKIIQELLQSRGLSTSLIRVASNPEFLKEGTAVNDFIKPDRVVVGTEDDDTANMLHGLYSSFMRKSDRFLAMDVSSAELCKYASNAMLATRISFVNSLARLCEKIGADIERVRQAMGSDPRIGFDFLFSGIGYGGSCLPRDVNTFIRIAKECGEELPLVEATNRINSTQTSWFFNKVKHYLEKRGSLRGKTVSVWGVAFKANTDDIRASRSVELIKLLISEGVIVKVYDPEALDNAKREFGDSLVYSNDMYDCASLADALIVCTDWSEFRNPDWNELRSKMRNFAIFDGRNLYSTHRHKIDHYDAVGLLTNEDAKARPYN